MPPNKRLHCSIVIFVIIIMRVRLFSKTIKRHTKRRNYRDMNFSMHRHVNANEYRGAHFVFIFHFSSFCFVGVCRFRHPPPVLNGVVVVLLFFSASFRLLSLIRSQSIELLVILAWMEIFSRIPRKFAFLFWVKCIRNLFTFIWRKNELTHAQMRKIGLFEFTVPDQALRIHIELECTCASVCVFQRRMNFRGVQYFGTGRKEW